MCCFADSAKWQNYMCEASCSVSTWRCTASNQTRAAVALPAAVAAVPAAVVAATIPTAACRDAISTGSDQS
jgi:hypothetical protein